MSINQKNFFLDNKKINVSNTSSLVNLKAELFKKKQDAIKNRLINKKDEFEKINLTKSVANSKWNQKAMQLDEKIRDSIRNRKVNYSKESKEKEEDNGIEKELKRSKENLERKAKLYEEKLKNAYDSLVNKKEELDDEQDEEEQDNLVDFQRKIIDASKEGLLNDFKQSDSSTSSTSKVVSLDQDEMVEYLDSFGRTRACKRSELNKIDKITEQELLRRKLDRDLSRDEDKNSNQYSNSYSNFIKSTDEQEEEANEESHYQNVCVNEIREHGTSYYQFALDEEKRKEQMQELNKLRHETIGQRKKADELIEKRNSAMKQRLIKLAKRKGLVVKEGDDLSDSEISEKMNLDQYLKNVPKEEEANRNAVDDLDYSINLKERELREWDKEKEDDLIKEQPFFIDKKGSSGYENDEKEFEKESRDFEFTPPQIYNSQKSKRIKTKQSVEDKVDDFLNQFN